MGPTKVLFKLQEEFTCVDLTVTKSSTGADYAVDEKTRMRFQAIKIKWSEREDLSLRPLVPKQQQKRLQWAEQGWESFPWPSG